MKTRFSVLMAILLGLPGGSKLVGAESPPTTPAASTTPPATPAPPPSAPPKLGSAELEKLLMPIALYPDPLLATMLPASVYPLEIVQAARFVADTNNLAKLDAQPWDPSVKEVARVPAVIKKMNDDLQWTIQLGEAFLAQDKDVMDTIQALRMKAQQAGTLHTTPQQTIVVTNTVVETTVEQQVVVVTNTIVQIQPSNPEIVYVPSYPATVYYPPPAYVYDPYAPLLTFAAGVTMGAIIANNCDWHHGGCYWGGGDVNVDIDRNTNIDIDRGDRNVNRGDRVNAQGGGRKWQPDQNRIRSSGSTASARTMESRGWGSGKTGAGSARASSLPASGSRGLGPTATTRPTGGGVASAPGSRAPTRPTGTPSVGSRPAANPSAANRSSAGSYPGGSANRPSPNARPSVSPSGGRSQSSSAFSGGGASQKSFSQRGAASRGGAARSGGGGRGGGGRR